MFGYGGYEFAAFSLWRPAWFSPGFGRVFEALYGQPGRPGSAKHHNKRVAKPTNRKPGKQQARERKRSKRGR